MTVLNSTHINLKQINTGQVCSRERKREGGVAGRREEEVGQERERGGGAGKRKGCDREERDDNGMEDL